MGLQLINQPLFSAYGGPWVDLPGKKHSSNHKVWKSLAARVPRVPFLIQNMHPDAGPPLPLHWSGFSSTLRYTYRYKAPIQIEQTFSGLSPTLRNLLRNADKKALIRSNDQSLSSLFELYTQSMLRKKQEPAFSYPALQKLHQALVEKNACKLLVATSPEGKLLAALYLSVDARWVSSLIAGQSEEGRKVSALHTLYWEGVQLAANLKLGFDFEGSMDPGIEQAYRAYGAMLCPYHRIYRPKNRLWELGLKLIRQQSLPF